MPGLPPFMATSHGAEASQPPEQKRAPPDLAHSSKDSSSQRDRFWPFIPTTPLLLAAP